MRTRFLAACLLAACGGGGGPAGPATGNQNNPGGGAAAQSATVQMRTALDVYGYEATSSFDPASVTIREGGTVTWSNASTAIHNVTFNAAAGAPANVANLTNGSVARSFASTGTFHYTCTNHAGMAGVVVVQ